MPDYASNFLAPDRAEVDRAKYSNALLRNRVNQLPQENQLQDLRIQGAQQELSQNEQAFSADQKKTAAGILAQRFGAVAQSQSPKLAAQQFLSDPDFQAAGKLLGLPVEQFTVTDQDNDDALRKSATDWARALGGKGEQSFQTIQGPDGSVLQQDSSTGELKSVLGREPRGATPSKYRPLSAEELQAYGLPAGTTAQIDTETGKVDLINRPTNATLGRPIPPAVAKGIIENRTSIGKIDRALEAVKARPQSFGAKNYFGDAVRQRSDPEGVDARAKVADIGSLLIHDRSGAAVSASEFPRLRPFIPQATDTDATITTKLQNLKANIEAMQDETQSIYSPEAGYKPMEAPQGNAAPDGTVVHSQDGRTLMKRGGQWVPQ